MKTIKSEIDESVNFITPCDDGGFFESRYVRRAKDYFICYLSSHSGCNRGCRMCHLTATNQTMMTPARVQDFTTQALAVFKHYIENCERAEYVNFNWMARGEPLCNTTVTGWWVNLSNLLCNMSSSSDGLVPRFNVSTIIPKTYSGNLDKDFRFANPTIFYSLYSLNPEFREKWLPGAQDPYIALDMLKEYQLSTRKIIKLHWAFIKGENDDTDEFEELINEIKRRKLQIEFNVVRYNPFSAEYGEESDRILQREPYQSIEWVLIKNQIPYQIVTRVGSDVKASCGTFVTGEEFMCL
jgi:23S rRNA (adenine2503-C2)-methyltransferase